MENGSGPISDETLYQQMSRVITMLGDYAETWLQTDIPNLGHRKPEDLLMSDDPNEIEDLKRFLRDMEYPEMNG